MNKVVHHNKTKGARETVIILADGYAYVMVSVSDESPDIAIVHDLVVHEYRRGEGLGRALLEESEKEAVLMGAETAKVLADSGSWLQEWYGRHGYRVDYVPEWRKVVLMSKDLTRSDAAEPQIGQSDFQ